jgi:hypothetical protein
MSARRFLPDPRHHSAGQALVETAIMLPILLILLLGAIDFGRAFFGWVNLQQAVRVGANFAATHPNMTPDERDRYVELIESDLAGLNCDLEAPVPNPTYTDRDLNPVANPTLGDYATLTLNCDFSPIIPLSDVFFGDPIAMAATSTFPIREGCISCPTPPPATPPPTPLQCRLVPDMDGMSVAGARLAWESAGFKPANFTPEFGQDTSTVESATVTQDDELSTCVLPTFAIFSSSVLIAVETPAEVVPPCVTVPNLVGVTLGDAIDAWTDAGFTGDFTHDDGIEPDPALVDFARVVVQQDTDPASDAGVTCIDPATPTVDVDTGDPWPAPPPAPCRVPNMINLFRVEGHAEWVEAGFATENFSPDSGQFKIRAQSLVGGTYVPCEAAITVSDKAS